MRSVIIIGVFLFAFCNNIAAQQATKLRIDPANAYGGTVSEYLSQVEYIPLETTKESLFGDINQLVITDSSYVVMDADTRSVLFFTLAGKYITKIKGNPNEYPNLQYQLTMKRVKIFTYNWETKKSVSRYFSVTGKALDIKETQKNATQEGRWLIADDYYLQLRSCAFSIDEKPKDSVYNLVQVFKGDSVYRTYFSHNQKEDMALCALGGYVRMSNTPENGMVYLSTPLDFSIYRLTTDTLQKLYQLVFPLNRTMPKRITESKDQAVVDSSRRNPRSLDAGVIRGVSNIFLWGEYIMFKIDATSYTFSTSSENKSQYNFIYHIPSGKLASLERILPDQSNSYLPLMDGARLAYAGLTYSQGWFYASVSSLKMFAAKEATKDKKPLYTSVVENYFKAEDRKSNPVLVRMKMKGMEGEKKAF